MNSGHFCPRPKPGSFSGLSSSHFLFMLPSPIKIKIIIAQEKTITFPSRVDPLQNASQPEQKKVVNNPNAIIPKIESPPFFG